MLLPGYTALRESQLRAERSCPVQVWACVRLLFVIATPTGENNPFADDLPQKRSRWIALSLSLRAMTILLCLICANKVGDCRACLRGFASAMLCLISIYYRNNESVCFRRLTQKFFDFQQSVFQSRFFNRGFGRESSQRFRRQRAVKHDEHAFVVVFADKPSERLRQLHTHQH